MPLSPINVGNQDYFLFDFSAWFASISGTPNFASNPIGVTFGAASISSAQVTVLITAPATPGLFAIGCTATDGSQRVLTLEQGLRVVP